MGSTAPMKFVAALIGGIVKEGGCEPARGNKRGKRQEGEEGLAQQRNANSGPHRDRTINPEAHLSTRHMVAAFVLL
eukprot:CAMPEP_0182574322 /NCGR_PEP_ID=MMETSP1324-20130603/24557_1 /TAXON_ID=236786 /ORGANISM="Florenciella sp., Strain RCC1587" /LENGTH=75 /DNA_ID=CAMNT_0024789649 /DNA_START=1 /DNA_END=224 /DNA_ORIENTATION=+